MTATKSYHYEVENPDKYASNEVALLGSVFVSGAVGLVLILVFVFNLPDDTDRATGLSTDVPGGAIASGIVGGLLLFLAIGLIIGASAATAAVSRHEVTAYEVSMPETSEAPEAAETSPRVDVAEIIAAYERGKRASSEE